MIVLTALLLLAAAPETVTVAPTKQSNTGNRLDQMVCLKTPRTGSLIAKSRLCKTRREWNLSAAANQEEWGAMQGTRGSSREDQPTWTGGTPP